MSCPEVFPPWKFEAAFVGDSGHSGENVDLLFSGTFLYSMTFS